MSTHFRHLLTQRRLVLSAMLTGAAYLSFAPSAALAQVAYPDKPVRIIVPFAAGTATDTLARMLAQHFSEQLKQSFIVENKAGANGAIGADAVAKARPDGYTLLVTTNTTQAANPGLMKSLPYDPRKDFAPISLLGKGAFVLAARTDAPFNTLQDFVAQARKAPGKISYASANSSGIISGATLSKNGGLDLIHVPYKSGPTAINDVLGGQTTTLFSDLAAALPHLRSQKLKALAVTTSQPQRALPDVPPLASAPGMQGFDLSYWSAIYAPRDTPDAILQVLNQQVVKFTQSTEVKEKFATLGFTIEGSSAKDLGQFTQAEIGKWQSLITAAGITPE